MPNRKRNESLTFRKWLESQKNSDTPIGDLAKDALRDTGWEGDSCESLLSRMRRMDASQEAQEALREAQRQFKALR